MSVRGFNTISDELLECANAAADYFDLQGYRIKIEPFELGYPSVPAFQAKRQHTSVLVDIVDRLNKAKAADWIAYCKTSKGDYRFVMAFSSMQALKPEDELWLRDAGVGVCLMHEERLVEKISPKDVSVPIHLPVFTELPKRLRALLGPAYDKIGAGNWLDGFEDACRLVEIEARRYLIQHSSTGRIQFVNSRGGYQLSSHRIDRMTLGQLAVAYSEIVTRTKTDEIVGLTLSSINSDRVGVVHHRGKATIEKKLRKNAGRHLWAIINALRLLLA